MSFFSESFENVPIAGVALIRAPSSSSESCASAAGGAGEAVGAGAGDAAGTGSAAGAGASAAGTGVSGWLGASSPHANSAAPTAHAARAASTRSLRRNIAIETMLLEKTSGSISRVELEVPGVLDRVRAFRLRLVIGAHEQF